MIVRIDELIQSFSGALTVIEAELAGVTTHHADRVAVLCSAIGKDLRMSASELQGLANCALLHDNALTEYIMAELEGVQAERNMRLHCVYGQRNVDTLPLGVDVSGYILYHHERADGSGPFGKVHGEFPLAAEIISMIDHTDRMLHLNRPQVDSFPLLKSEALEGVKKIYSPEIVDSFERVFTSGMFESIQDDRICDTVLGVLPVWESSVEDSAIIRIAQFSARIIDYKSRFTRKHTSQIANRIWLMCDYYGFDGAKRAKLYLAAALHDIGKLHTPSAILEKHGPLTKEEYAIIMKHVWYTHEHLKNISGFEDICRWASNHHEKLDGSGYPFGLTANELDFPSRLMACIDIYQAASEVRPYHPRRSHKDTMPILYGMAEKGKIDMDIVRDVDKVMAPYSGQDIPDIALEGCTTV